MNKKEMSKKRIIIILSIGILFTIGIGGYIINYYLKEKNNNEIGNNEEQEEKYENNGWYESIEHIEDDTFIIKHNKKYGIINSSGKVMIDFLYDKISKNYTSSDKYNFKINDKYGLMDIDEQVLVEALYDKQIDVCKDKFIVKYNNKYGVIDKNGKEIIKYDENFIDCYSVGNEKNLIVNDGDYNIFYDLDGKEIKREKYSKKIIYTMDDMPAVEVISKHRYTDINSINNRKYYAVKGNKSYILDETASVLLEFDGIYNIRQFNGSALDAYRNNIFIACGVDNPIGTIAINNDNKIIIQGDYFLERLYDEKNDRTYIIVITKNNKYGLLDINGETIIPIEYDKIEAMSEDNERAVLYTKKDNNHYIMTLEGKILKELNIDEAKVIYYPTFDYFKKSFPGFALQIRKNGKYGLISPNGNIVLETKYELQKKEEWDAAVTCEGPNGPMYDEIAFHDVLSNYKYFTVKKDNKYAIVNRSDGTISKYYDYFINSMDDKYIVFERNNRKGVMNLEGEMLLDSQYSSIYFKDDYFKTKLGEQCNYELKFVFDSNGELVTNDEKDLCYKTADEKVIIRYDNGRYALYIDGEHIIFHN